MYPPHLLTSVMFTNSLLGRFISLLWLNSSPYFLLLKKVLAAPGIYEGAWRQVFLTVPSSEKNSKSAAVQEGKLKAVNLTGFSCCSANLADKIKKLRFVS